MRSHALWLPLTLLGSALAVPAAAQMPQPTPTHDWGGPPKALARAQLMGPADDQSPMEHMILALKLQPGAEARLERRLADLQDVSSPQFQQWLTPEQVGAEFGQPPEAVDRVTDWLQEQGFRIDEVAAGRLAVIFSGTVGQVVQAFRTPMGRFMLDGKVRQGNLREPAIPPELADVVEGVVSLHNVPRQALNRGIRPAGEPLDSSYHELTPGDFAAIYNLRPLYKEGVDGRGVTVGIVGRTHIPVADVATFRKAFGLPKKDPEIMVNGDDPGDLGMEEDGEADLDVEWAGAVARKATIRFVVSKSTDATDGVDLSAYYIVNHNLASVMSTSFGACEEGMGKAECAFYHHVWAQAALQGISSLVASGDSGPAGCNGGGDGCGSGLAVSGLASTPFNLAVGGSQFNEGSGHYWKDQPDPDHSSALRYIPEQAWNESGSAGGSGLWASGGGLSARYPKPRWQVAKGVPRDAAFRCIPDLSMAAAGNHDAYVIETQGGRATVGGTSCSSPAFAGIMALVVQKTRRRQGNPAHVLYNLGHAQYAGRGPEVFHDITEGDSSVPCTKGFPCGPGYDLATGLGTVDARALVDAWKTGLGHNVDAMILKPEGDLTVPGGTELAFTGTGFDTSTDTHLTYVWDFGDGVNAAGTVCHHIFRNSEQVPVNRTVTFTAIDTTGAQGTDTRTVRVLPGAPDGDQIINGGFEYGFMGWRAKGPVSVGNNFPNAPAHGGTGNAWFWGSLLSEPALLQQTVRIPTGAASARLVFWLHIEPSGITGLPGDHFQVKARGADGKLAVLASFTNLDNAKGYQQHQVGLGGYRGQTVQISFVAQDALFGSLTSFALDDVSLRAK